MERCGGKQLTHAQTDGPEINGGDMKSLRAAASVDVGRAEDRSSFCLAHLPE